MASSGPKSLTGLCSICYTEQPKYCCPRCKTKTCSLPCYKKHQQRASCNGQRDPAAFVKKSQWATPSGVDHDYNYLKSVEKRIDDGAETNGDLSKIQLQNSRIEDRRRNPASSLNQYLASNHIFVQRAPIGMSRSRLNRTRVSAGSKTEWTIEWIDQNHVKSVQHNCPDSFTIARLYFRHQSLQRRAQEKLQATNEGSEPPSKKRRKDLTDRVTDGDNANNLTKVEKRSSDLIVDGNEVQVRAVSAPGGETREELVSDDERDILQPKAAQPVRDEDQQTRTESDLTLKTAHKSSTEATVPMKPGPQPDLASQKLVDSNHTSQVPHDEVKYHFYFHKTNIPAKETLLVPLDSEKSLLNCLKGQQMQEFPSIYVLPNSPDDLPSDFMTMQAFHESRKAARSEINESTQQVTEMKAAPAFGRNSQPDPLQILQMLKRDLSMQ